MKRGCIWITCVALSAACLLAPLAALALPAEPQTTPEGFLPEGQSPYVYASEDEGLWRYVDQELSVRIERKSDVVNDKPVIWFVTDIRCCGETKLTSMLTTASKIPGHSFRSPVDIAQQYGAVLAFSDDFYSNRWYNKGTQGIIIRNGVVYSEKTFKNHANAFPPLEILALFEDGSLKTFDSKEHTAQEYLDMGVTDTFAFGPILVRDGALGERMYDENYSPYREPRCALGMIEPRHYVVLTVDGREDDSRGARLRWLADQMLELGAVEAMNLDGGNTTSLVFMGERLNRSGQDKLRSVGSILGIGLNRLPQPAQ